MRILAAMGIGWVAGLLPAAAQEPALWRDPVHGCAYLLPAQGGIAPRYRSDGRPDCTDPAADPGVTGSVSAPEGATGSTAAGDGAPPAPARDEAAACLLFSATCVTRDATLAPSVPFAISGSSLESGAP